MTTILNFLNSPIGWRIEVIIIGVWVIYYGLKNKRFGLLSRGGVDASVTEFDHPIIYWICTIGFIVVFLYIVIWWPI